VSALIPTAMQENTPFVVDQWSLPLRLLHWTTVLLLGVQFAVALLPIGSGIGGVAGLGFHVSLGALLAIVFSARLVCRLFDRGPHGRRIAARLLQGLLYLLAFTVSASGWLAYRPSPFAGRALLFNYVELPKLVWSHTTQWIVWHRWAVWLLLGVSAGHIALAIYHLLRPGDRRNRAMSIFPNR